MSESIEATKPRGSTPWIPSILLALLCVPATSTLGWAVLALRSHVDTPSEHTDSLFQVLVMTVIATWIGQGVLAILSERKSPLAIQAVGFVIGLAATPVLGVMGLMLLGPHFGLQFHLF